MSEQRTVRLILPQWQGGVNPDYLFGAELLAQVLPPDDQAETIHVPVSTNLAASQTATDGVAGKPVLLQQMAETKSILDVKQPDRVITAGGDCSISEAPFDYLSGKYGERLGVLWLDVHPDIADPSTSQHVHEMVVANLLGKGDPDFSKAVANPILPRQLMYGGLDHAALRPMDQAVDALGIRYATPEDLASDSQSILDWLAAEQLTHLAVHFDLDVLTPADFRSILPAQPHTAVSDFCAAVGQMALRQIVRVMHDVSQHADIVGFSIAEHMPWDAINLRHALREIAIFK